MNACIPVSKIPCAVVLDVLSLIRRSEPPADTDSITGTTARKPAKLALPLPVFRRFIGDCLHTVRRGAGSRLTEIQEQFVTWGETTGHWTEQTPSCRDFARLFRAAGIETYSAHNRQTAVRGWRLN